MLILIEYWYRTSKYVMCFSQHPQNVANHDLNHDHNKYFSHIHKVHPLIEMIYYNHIL